jgi:hypothetical protein
MDEIFDMDETLASKAALDQIPVLLHDPREEILRGLLENPLLREIHLCLMLGRKDISSALLEKIAGRDDWMSSYRVRRALAFHPNVPQALGLRLVRELYAPDMVQLTFLPSGQPALRQLAEELVLARLPQLSIAQKMTLARRGPARLVGALLQDGSPELLPTVLDSPHLSEGHVLKALARIALPARVVAAIADHGRWSNVYSVRLALVRNPQTPLVRVLSFLPGVSTTDLRFLKQSHSVPVKVQPYIQRELSSRMQHGKWVQKTRGSLE